ncbi:MAG: Polyprenol monophosphomannose synthase [Candidatus Marinimicrobia bacterium]|nr:Polyprenol monophosphomannose synthase [Candidatus Neomarinimicrobiota bacterium]
MRNLIVIPTYNESENIKDLIEQIFKLPITTDILIVDDNSPDGTGELIEELILRYSRLYLMKRNEKEGLGTAYKVGFTYALERGYDNIVQMDADLSHDPEEIPTMLEELKSYDLVIGSRYNRGVSVVHWPIRRLILSYGANLYTRIITGMPVTDGTSGFKAWRSDVLKTIELDRVSSQGYSFQIEMNFRAWKNNFKIKEHPIIFHDRVVGKSKMSKKIILEAVYKVWSIKLRSIFRRL